MQSSTAALAYLKLLKRIRRAKGQQGGKKGRGVPLNPRKGHDRKRRKSEITVTHPNLYLQEPPSKEFPQLLPLPEEATELPLGILLRSNWLFTAFLEDHLI